MADSTEVISDWQSSRGLSESLWYMFEKQLMCDIVFEVGEDYERIGAHSAVLAARSSALFQKLSSELADMREIEIGDVRPVIFRQFLRYLYTSEEPDLLSDDESCDIILNLAERYNVTSLTDLIVGKKLSSMTPDKFCEFLKSYGTFSLDKKKKFLAYVFKDASHVFGCESFSIVPYEFLLDLLSSEYLILDEETICTSVLLWAAKACENESLEVNGTNQRTVLKGALYQVRFPLLNQGFFTENISEKGLLSAQEEVQLLKYFLNPNSEPQWKFRKDRRKAPSEGFSQEIQSKLPSATLTLTPGNSSNINSSSSTKAEATSSSGPVITTIWRFSQHGQGWGYRGNKKDAVAFTSSRNIKLKSILVFGSSKQDSKLDVTVIIKHGDVELYTKHDKIESTKSKTAYEIAIDTDLEIVANEQYHIIIQLTADTGYYGKGGKSSINAGDVTINFMRSKFSTNNTTETIGQIEQMNVLLTPCNYRPPWFFPLIFSLPTFLLNDIIILMKQITVSSLLLSFKHFSKFKMIKNSFFNKFIRTVKVGAFS